MLRLPRGHLNLGVSTDDVRAFIFASSLSQSTDNSKKKLSNWRGSCTVVGRSHYFTGCIFSVSASIPDSVIMGPKTSRAFGKVKCLKL